MAKNGIFGEVSFKSKNFKKRVDDITESFDKAATDRLKIMGLEIQSRAKKLIQTPSRGRVYPRKRKPHVASKPGDPPNIDSGTLWRSIDMDFEKTLQVVTVGTNVKYGKLLEFGTRKIAARPWLSRAFRGVLQKFKNKKIIVKPPSSN